MEIVDCLRASDPSKENSIAAYCGTSQKTYNQAPTYFGKLVYFIDTSKPGAGLKGLAYSTTTVALAALSAGCAVTSALGTYKCALMLVKGVSVTNFPVFFLTGLVSYVAYQALKPSLEETKMTANSAIERFNEMPLDETARKERICRRLFLGVKDPIKHEQKFSKENGLKSPLHSSVLAVWKGIMFTGGVVLAYEFGGKILQTGITSTLKLAKKLSRMKGNLPKIASICVVVGGVFASLAVRTFVFEYTKTLAKRVITDFESNWIEMRLAAFAEENARKSMVPA
jgi:hypothetical protein